MREHARLTVGITTRNRQLSLRRCLASLDVLGELITEVIVVDDSSDVPVADSLGLPASLAVKTQVVRQTASEGYIAGRNTIMRLATNEYVLLLDDDAYLIAGDVL
jgi:glycosyltransferase involved in cell wall biosynthesis